MGNHQTKWRQSKIEFIGGFYSKPGLIKPEDIWLYLHTCVYYMCIYIYIYILYIYTHIIYIYDYVYIYIYYIHILVNNCRLGMVIHPFFWESEQNGYMNPHWWPSPKHWAHDRRPMVWGSHLPPSSYTYIYIYIHIVWLICDNIFWLVVFLPLWKYEFVNGVGMVYPIYEMENNQAMFESTNNVRKWMNIAMAHR